MPRSFWRLWFPPLLYLVAIFGVSSIPKIKPPSAIKFGLLDKMAHFFEYAVLGFLLIRAFRGHRGAAGLLSVLFTLLVCYAVGGLDEIYQGTVPGREMSLADWAADILGATVGVLTYRFVFDRPAAGELAEPGE